MLPRYWLRHSPRRDRAFLPFNEVERFHHDLERWFGGASAASGFPRLNVYKNADGALLTAELPGVKPETLDISVSGNTVVLKGERPAPVEEEGRVHRRERGCGKFERALELPFRVDAEKVEARCENGVLELRLPRAESDKPRKVSVKAVQA